MKYLVTITLITFLLSTSFSQIDKRPTDPTLLGKMVFKSFHNEDYELFLKYIFTEADGETMVKNALASDSAKITIIEQVNGISSHIRQTSKENFEMIILAGNQKGIKWQKVKLLEVKFQIKNKNNIQSTDIFLLCKYKEIKFQIKLDNCHKSDAWLMLDNPEINFNE